jgi:cell division inhibitor SepF
LRQIDAAGFSAKFEEVDQDAERLVQAAQPQGTSLSPRPVSERDLVHVGPQGYWDARAIGEAFRAGKPVPIDLTQMGAAEARRLVDFAAGLISWAGAQ